MAKVTSATWTETALVQILPDTNEHDRLAGGRDELSANRQIVVAARNALPDLLAIARAAAAHEAADDELLRMLWVSDDCEEKAKAWMASETARGALRAALAKLERGGT